MRQPMRSRRAVSSGMRRARDRHHRHVVILEMRQDAFEVIDAERAAHALQRLIRTLHDVLHEKLAPAAEQVREGHAPLR